MKPLKPKSVIEAWIDAHNRKNLDKITALYAENAAKHTASEAPINGRQAIRDMYIAAFAAARMIYTVGGITEKGQWALLEWRDSLGLSGCEVFHIVDGKIQFQKGYWDKLSFLLQHGPPLPTEW